MEDPEGRFFRFNQALAERLHDPYTPPNISGGHDFTHVERMCRMEPDIKKRTGLDFDHNEFVAAVWLHNLNRCNDKQIKETIEAASGAAGSKKEELANYCRIILANSPFDLEQRERIIDAVLQHDKKDDESDDSPLLTALQIADKLDWLGTLGILAIAAHSGARFLPYNPDKPFGYDSTAEKKLKSIYNDFFRVLEWYGMLPSDEARSLVDIRKLRFFIQFLRMLGEEIAEATGEENLVDDNIRKALGPYYHSVLGMTSSPEIEDEIPGLRQPRPGCF